jgi:RNA polymerase sigma factor (sigma-70 family)
MKNDLPTYTDDILIAMIQGLGKDRDAAIQYVLKSWKHEAVAVLNRKSATKAEIEYVLEEAIVAFDKHIRHGTYRQESSLKTFFISIFKQTFRNKDRSGLFEKGHTPLDEKTTDVATGETSLTQMYSRDVSTFVQKILAVLSPRCRDMLTLYMLSFTNREIKEQMNIPSESAVGNALFECRQKFRLLCEKSPLFKKIIQELLSNE